MNHLESSFYFWSDYSFWITSIK